MGPQHVPSPVLCSAGHTDGGPSCPQLPEELLRKTHAKRLPSQRRSCAEAVPCLSPPLWSSPAGDSQVHPLGALLSADVADVPCSGVPATSPDTLRSLSTGVTQPHCFWWLDLPHPAGSHPNSWSPLQSWHSCPLHGHGIHAAMGHVPFLECSRPKQESLHFEVTGVTQDQLLQHREVPPGPAG